MKTSIIAFAVVILLVGLATAFSKKAHSAATTPAFSFDPDTIRPWICGGCPKCVSEFETLSVPQVGELLLKRVSSVAGELATATVDPFPAVSLENPHKKKMLEVATKLRSAVKFDGENGRPQVHHEVLRNLIKEHATPTSTKSEDAAAAKTTYPYFGMIPHFHGNVLPGGKPFSYSSPCFGSITATPSKVSADGKLTISFAVSDQKSWFCTDHMLISGGDALKFEMFDAAKDYSVTLDVSKAVADPLKNWYLNSRGVKIMRFTGSYLDMIGDLLDTVTMMTGFAQKPIRTSTFEANLHFMQDYVTGTGSKRMGPKTELRTVGPVVANQIDTSYIQSGDAMLVLRPDGLDPMIAWGEGATVGHSVVFNRDAQNGLHVCESTALDSYWPKNGIQCHTWDEWRSLAMAAEYNVVLVPLSPKYQSYFNSTAAWGFFNESEGLNYGYQTFLFGWLDTKTGDDPCLPPDYTTCLVPHLTEAVALLVDGAFGSNEENFFRQAINHRLGTWETNMMSVMQALQYGEEKFKYDLIDDIYTIPEQDTWSYHTTRNNVSANGKSMVCCVFVCHMWKAAGVFREIDHEINCGEQTLWDIFSMKIFDDNKMGANRPEVCKQNDPSNELCQMMGNFTLNLKPDLNTRALYKWMGQNCSSSGPDYIRQPGC